MITHSPAPCYTHQDHAKACGEAAREKRPLRQCVQVSYHGAPQCALIVDAWDAEDARPMWKVKLIGEVKGLMSFPVALVRKCSGYDGNCHCSKDFSTLSTNG